MSNGSIESYRALFRATKQLFTLHYTRFLLLILFGCITVLANLLPPVLLMQIIDEGLQKADFRVTLVYTSYSIAAMIAAAAVSVIFNYQAMRIGRAVVQELRSSVFSHLTKLSIRFFTGTRSGEILSRLLSDVDVVDRALTLGIGGIAVHIPGLISCMIAMFLLEWRLALAALLFVPVIGVLTKSAIARQRKLRIQVQSQQGELFSMAQENLSISGAILNKTIGRGNMLIEKFDRTNQMYSASQLKAARNQAFFFSGLLPVAGQIPALGVTCLAVWFMRHGEGVFPIGLLIVFSSLQTKMYSTLTSLVGVHYALGTSFVSFERILQYLNLPPDISDKPDAEIISNDLIKGEVAFEHVWFRYDRSTPAWNLCEINLTAKPGNLIALVGPTGAGKSTITHLICRLYDVEIGKVCIDGIDIRDFKLEQLLSLIAVVSQETYFFNSSIEENLKLANVQASHDQMREACSAAAIDEHIMSLPDGYKTVIGERGYKLSGGERQRLSIARALLKSPLILILDEATSALDSQSEKRIQQSLKHLMKGRTTFAIAHRLSTIESADLIVVVEHGRIVESGTHEELIKAGRRYTQLKLAQSGAVSDSDYSDPLLGVEEPSVIIQP